MNESNTIIDDTSELIDIDIVITKTQILFKAKHLIIPSFFIEKKGYTLLK
jgi:hypothetical protein